MKLYYSLYVNNFPDNDISIDKALLLEYSLRNKLKYLLKGNLT